MSDRTYIAIDLKSFYASVECVARGLDPLTTNLVVADKSRTDKTICLAVSPSMKAYGIGGRARLFEVVQRVKEVNYERRRNAGWHFTGKSSNDIELQQVWSMGVNILDALTGLVLVWWLLPKYALTAYLGTYKTTPHELAIRMIRDVLATTGITATAGIGTNMYLAKVAMDIVAKHVPADKDGVRIAELDEMSYRRTLWNHRPLTAFWRFGRGIATKLAEYGITTMGQIARKSLQNEEFFYNLFGVNAELLIDHAWGWEPCTIDYVKAYRPETNSFSSGQVLQEPYEWSKAKVVLQEMADAMALSLFSKHLVTDQLVLTINYDTENLTDPERRARYTGPVTTDYYGRTVPKHAHGTENLSRQTSSSSMIVEAAVRLYERITDPTLLVRRITLVTNHVVHESQVRKASVPAQLDLFTDYEAEAQQRKEEEDALEKERRLQAAQLAIKSRFGKNAILRGMSYTDGATAKDRNEQIGGHKA